MKKFLILLSSVIVLSACATKPTSPTCECAQTLRIGSFNVLGNRSIARGKIGSDIVRIYDWDIYGTQEMNEWAKPVYLAKDNIYGIVGRPCSKKEEDEKAWERWGNYIIYKKARFEVLKSGYFWLSETPDKLSRGWDEKQYRICNWAKFHDKLANKDFYFFNLHQGLTPTARQNSAKLIVKKLEEIAGKNSTIFMTGDFNAINRYDSITTILKSGLVKDAWMSKAPKYGPKGSFIPANHNKATCNKSAITGEGRIDYVFTSPSVSIKKCIVITTNLDGHFPSDHLPVMAEVKY